MLGPTGDIVEEWQLKGTYISQANWNTLEYQSNEVADITIQLTYDYAILNF
jgi:hypothetical protein